MEYLLKYLVVKTRLTKWHFYLLGIVILNYCIGMLTGFKLNQNVTFIIKIILYASGFILFLESIKQFTIIGSYYLYYAISVVLTGLFFVFGGAVLTLVMYVVLFPVIPKEAIYKKEKIIIYYKSQGMIKRCCEYEVVESKFGIFEKHVGYINTRKPIDAKNDNFQLKNNKIFCEYKTNGNGYETAKDTIEVINWME